MKKSTKSEKPAAPQAKSVKISVEPVPAKKAVAPKKVARPKPAPVEPAAVAPAPAATRVAPVETKTTIIAQFDVGFGNQLFLRGDGPGLSWDSGVLMDCVADSQWTHTVVGAASPVLFKFLINDHAWNVGPDYTVAPGATVVLTPTF